MADVIEQDKMRDQQLQDLLEQYGGDRSLQKEEVIYGVYDNTNKSLFTRINDFLIDHSKISLKSKAYFFHLMSVMIDAGIPLLQALQILKRRENNPHFARIIATLHHAVTRGQTLSVAAERFPKVFSASEIGVVKSGEAVGRLNEMLARLSVQLDKNNELKMKLTSASTYPVIVIGVLILVGVAMLVTVIPSLLELLEQSGLQYSDYPAATRFLIALSDGIQSYWWAIILGLLTVWGLFQVYVRTATGRFKWHYFLLRVPVLGSLLRKVYVLQFVRMLGILVDAGLPVIKSLQIIASSLNNELYKLKVWQLIAAVQKGQKISDNLQTSPFLFSETVTHMISIGEKTASLALISEKVGDHYDREISHSLRRLTSLFEPLMIVLVGISVAFLALAVLSPIFKITQTIS